MEKLEYLLNVHLGATKTLGDVIAGFKSRVNFNFN